MSLVCICKILINKNILVRLGHAPLKLLTWFHHRCFFSCSLRWSFQWLVLVAWSWRVTDSSDEIKGHPAKCLTCCPMVLHIEAVLFCFICTPWTSVSFVLSLRLLVFGLLVHILTCWVFHVSDNSDPSAYSGKIIECSFDTDNQKWVWMRTRVDKGTPNDYNTYRKVFL